MQPIHLKKITLATTLICLMSACSTDQSLLSSKVDYRSGSDNLNKNALEVPPDLTSISNSGNTSIASANTNSSTAAPSQQTVLPTFSNARVVTQDGIRFIEVDTTPDKAWNALRDFWLANGFILTTENPQVGVMETDWLENRATLPTNFTGSLLKKFTDQFLSTGNLDKYRTRIERSPVKNGTVNIYISHRGMTEEYKAGELGMSESWKGTMWVATPPNPELEAEIMVMALQSLGSSQADAQASVNTAPVASTRASLSSTGTEVIISDNFDRAWRRVGLAFDRIGYNVQDKNRSTGIYSVQRAATDIDKESESNYWSSLAFWNKAETSKATSVGQTYDVKLAEQNGKTILTLSSKEGAIDPAVQKKMLNDLLVQLK